MQPRSIAALRRDARVMPIAPAPMSRRQRLERWADLLMRDPGRPLMPMLRTEGLRLIDRRALRHLDSPMAVAYADPVLRAQGLRDDSFGATVDFFDLTERAAHDLLCDCGYHGTMTAASTAYRIDVIKRQTTPRAIWRGAQRALRVAVRRLSPRLSP
jgi:hypothetical protein